MAMPKANIRKIKKSIKKRKATKKKEKVESRLQDKSDLEVNQTPVEPTFNDEPSRQGPIESEPEVSKDLLDSDPDAPISGPEVPVRVPKAVTDALNNPQTALAQAAPQVPTGGSSMAKQIMALPELPNMSLPAPPAPRVQPQCAMRPPAAHSGVQPFPMPVVKPNPAPQTTTSGVPSSHISAQQIAHTSAGPVNQPISTGPTGPVNSPTPTGRTDTQFNWTGRDLFVAMPCYKFTNPATMWVAVQLALDLGKDLARYDMEMGDAMIYHARNKLADRFLKSGCTWMFFLDDDIIPPTGRATWMQWVGNLPQNPWSNDICGRHVLTRLMSHRKSLVGGNYFGRQVTGVPVSAAAWNPQEEQLARQMMNRVAPVDWIGTGCLLIHRQVFLDIQTKFPHLAPTGQRKWWDFFLPTEHGGEDVSFGLRAKQAGHQSWLDTGVQCLHVGWSCFGAHNTGQKARHAVA